MRKSLPILLALTLLLVSASVYQQPFGLAQSGTNVSYIIGTDTTWTQANGPYNFIGNVVVNNGVTLTIAADTMVNFNAYYLRVNGTLIIQPGATLNLGMIGDGIDIYGTLSAQGTSTNPIHINGAIQGHINFATYSTIWFYPTSTGWNQPGNFGSLIENTIFNQTGLEMESPIKVSDSTFLSGGLVVVSASPIIVNNKISSGLSVIKNPNTPGTIYNQGNGSEVIEPEIKNNTITGSLGIEAGGGVVEDNTISVASNNPNSGYIGAMLISDDYGVPIYTLVQRNLINNSPIGISINIQYAQNNKATLQNNTVTNNTVGLQIGRPNVPAITNNNIYANSYNAKLSGVSSQVSLPNNWWGTTDLQALNQTIYDFKNDFNLGTVNFLPILTSANPSAMPDPNAPITSTPTPSPSPTAVPSTHPTLNPNTATPTPTENSPSTTPFISTPTPTLPPTTNPSTTVPEFPLVLGFVFLVMVAVGFAAVYRKKGYSLVLERFAHCYLLFTLISCTSND